jgi:hypothetical protein
MAGRNGGRTRIPPGGVPDEQEIGSVIRELSGNFGLVKSGMVNRME